MSQNPIRCAWAQNQFPEYIMYHDEEWGVPVHDDHKHFEFLILEGAQAGLSWATVLKKRDGYRNAFANFDPEKVAEFPDAYVEELIQDPAIIRNRLKVASAINNARKFLETQAEYGSFDHYIWSFVDGKTIQNQWKNMAECPPNSDISDKLSKDLKKRGFKFVGTTVMYAHMQACGLVNDHTTDCFRYRELKQ